MIFKVLPPKNGYSEIFYNNLAVYKRVSDGRLFYPDLETPIIPYTPKENRKRAYETFKIIEYENEKYSVDEMAKIFWQYYPENSSKCDEIREKIINAKKSIRELYPDIDD